MQPFRQERRSLGSSAGRSAIHQVAGVAGLHTEELRVAHRECKTKLVFRQECTEQNTAQTEEIAMCPANNFSAVCLAPSQCRF